MTLEKVTIKGEGGFLLYSPIFAFIPFPESWLWSGVCALRKRGVPLGTRALLEGHSPQAAVEAKGVEN